MTPNGVVFSFSSLCVDWCSGSWLRHCHGLDLPRAAAPYLPTSWPPTGDNHPCPLLLQHFPLWLREGVLIRSAVTCISAKVIWLDAPSQKVSQALVMVLSTLPMKSAAAGSYKQVLSKKVSGDATLRPYMCSTASACLWASSQRLVTA